MVRAIFSTLVMFWTSERFQVPSQHTTRRRAGRPRAWAVGVASDTASPMRAGDVGSNVLRFGRDVHPPGCEAADRSGSAGNLLRPISAIAPARCTRLGDGPGDMGALLGVLMNE